MVDGVDVDGEAGDSVEDGIKKRRDGYLPGMPADRCR
jgi:hypothetical protein